MTAIDVDSAQKLVDESGFGSWWGFLVQEVDVGSATVLLPARPELLRPGNILHGGGCMTLADIALWLAIMSVTGPDDHSVTVDMTTKFERAATGDIISTANVISDDGRVIRGEATTHDLCRQVVATHTLTYLRPKARSESAS